MNSNPEALACGYGYSKTVPKRRFRRRVGVRRLLPPGARPRGRPPTKPRPARGVRRTEVGREDRLAVALHAPRPASVGGRLPANAAVAQSGGLRGHGPRFAHTPLAAFEGQGVRADGGDTRLSHTSLHPGERLAGWLRRKPSARRARRCTPRWTPWDTCLPCTSARPPSRSASTWVGWQEPCKKPRASRWNWHTSTRATPGREPPKKRRLVV